MPYTIGVKVAPGRQILQTLILLALWNCVWLNLFMMFHIPLAICLVGIAVGLQLFAMRVRQIGRR